MALRRLRCIRPRGRVPSPAERSLRRRPRKSHRSRRPCVRTVSDNVRRRARRYSRNRRHRSRRFRPPGRPSHPPTIPETPIPRHRISRHPSCRARCPPRCMRSIGYATCQETQRTIPSAVSTGHIAADEIFPRSFIQFIARYAQCHVYTITLYRPQGKNGREECLFPPGRSTGMQLSAKDGQDSAFARHRVGRLPQSFPANGTLRSVTNGRRPKIPAERRKGNR